MIPCSRPISMPLSDISQTTIPNNSIIECVPGQGAVAPLLYLFEAWLFLATRTAKFANVTKKRCTCSRSGCSFSEHTTQSLQTQIRAAPMHYSPLQCTSCHAKAQRAHCIGIIVESFLNAPSFKIKHTNRPPSTLLASHTYTSPFPLPPPAVEGGIDS